MCIRDSLHAVPYVSPTCFCKEVRAKRTVPEPHHQTLLFSSELLCGCTCGHLAKNWLGEPVWNVAPFLFFGQLNVMARDCEAPSSPSSTPPSHLDTQSHLSCITNLPSQRGGHKEVNWLLWRLILCTRSAPSRDACSLLGAGSLLGTICGMHI